MLATWKKRMTWQRSLGRYKPLTAFYSGKVSLKEMPGHTQFWSRYPDTGGSSRRRMRMPSLAKESTSPHRWWCRRCCSGEVQTSNSSFKSICVRALPGGCIQHWKQHPNVVAGLPHRKCHERKLGAGASYLHQEHWGLLLPFHNKWISFCPGTFWQ